MKFSLILATVGRVDELVNFLRSLERQTYRNFELIICDQNRDDRVSAILREFRTLSVLHLRTEPGLSRSRNCALNLVSGDVVGFPDDDCLYPDNLLKSVHSFFSTNYHFDGLCGRPVNYQNRTTAGKFLNKATTVTLYNAPFCFCSFTMFLRKYVIEKVGPFDEALGLGAPTPLQSSEDLDYGIRALKMNFRFFYDPDITVIHPDKENHVTKETIIRAYMYALGTGYTLWKNSYPLWYSLYYIIRPLLGIPISMLRRDFTRIKLHMAKFKGRFEGYFFNKSLLSRVAK